MVSLKTLLTNPYANEEVTNTRLAGATIVVLPKLVAANTSGQYDAVIEEINATFPPFNTKIVEIATDISLGKGFTENREQVAADFLAFVRDNYKDIQVKYKTNKAKLLQFYPNMMKDYSAGNKSTWYTLMVFYAKAATTNSADFPVPFVTAANAFPATYLAASDAQSVGLMDIGDDRGDRNELRPPLEDALFQMIHTVFVDKRGNVSKIKAIIDLKSLLPHPRTSIQHFNSVIDANKTNNLMFEAFDISYVFFARNTGLTDLRLCLSPTADGACSIDAGTLKAGKAHTFLAPTLGPLTNQYFNITNLDPGTQGSYEVSVYRQ